MTRAQAIRHEVLLQLYGAGRLGATASHIGKVCRRAGEDFSDAEIAEALAFHVDQGFAATRRDEGTGVVRHRVTSKGILHWEETEAR
jgi:hypothetical protein